jgi:hypothetical protein
MQKPNSEASTGTGGNTVSGGSGVLNSFLTSAAAFAGAQVASQLSGQVLGRPPILNGQYGNQGFGYQGLNNQGIGNQGFGYQGLNNQGFGYQGLNNQGFGNQGLNNQGLGNQGLNNQGFGYQGLNFGNQGLNNQGLNNQGFNNQGLNNQGFNNQGLNNQGFNNQGFGNQGHFNNGYGNYQGLYNQGFSNQGYGNPFIGNQALGGYGLNSQQGFGNQGLANRPTGHHRPSHHHQDENIFRSEIASTSRTNDVIEPASDVTKTINRTESHQNTQTLPDLIPIYWPENPNILIFAPVNNNERISGEENLPVSRQAPISPQGSFLVTIK